MKRKELFQNVLAYLGSTMDDTETELNYTTPYELLIAVVLSAQCTDKRINAVAPRPRAGGSNDEGQGATTAKELNENSRN